MNQKRFKRCMQQGLGRCALVLQASDKIDAYKETVLWGCLHNLSYDTQCEGTRASYVYRLTTYFKDPDYFLRPTIAAFEKLPRRSDWLFSHFTELLQCFAENGSDTAKQALQQRYDRLFSALLNKRRFGRYNFERGDFEKICLSLSSLGGIDALLKIANDMGRLFRKNPYYCGYNFGWFCLAMSNQIGEKKFHAILRKEAKSSENIDRFYQDYLKSAEEARSIVRKPIEIPSAEDAEKIKLAEAALAETDLDIKAELLSAFSFRDKSFPLSHEAIIEYSRSAHEHLREVAFGILENCQSEIVRDYALTLLAEERHKTGALRMLICNYAPEIKVLLLDELYQNKINDRTEADRHSIGFKILNVCDQNVPLPKEFFIYIYETTRCSCCRESAIRALAKRGWLTREIIEECRHDSNCEISQYINRDYPPRS